MTSRNTVVLFACSLMLCASSTVWAQRWGQDDFPRDGVCFFKDPNYHGDYFCARTGENLSFVPGGMNDRISSIRILGRAEVTVFRDARFSGRSERFRGDVRNLKEEGWNDLISSLRVRHTSGGHYSSGRSDDPDRIVRRAYEDILDRKPDSAGLRLYRSRIIDDGWSEAEVREALRNSPEYREKNTMTYPKAQDIVRRAYLSVLKREPDADSRGYVDKVFRDHWTQQDVERELRQSSEYRKKGR